MEHAEEPVKQVIDDPPPFLGEWPRVYVLVLVWLLALILLFYFFTLAYAP